MNLKVGQYCKIKNDLVINKKYGTVTYSSIIHNNYLGKLLQIQRISSAGTAYCYLCEDSGNITKEVVGTFSESMLDFPKFEIGQYLLLSNNKVVHIKKLDVKCSAIPSNAKYDFMYYYYESDDTVNFIFENALLSKSVVIGNELSNENLNTINVNENDKNRLQKQETNLSGRDRLTGRGIQGRTNKVTISSKPLRNPKSIRGK